MKIVLLRLGPRLFAALSVLLTTTSMRGETTVRGIEQTLLDDRGLPGRSWYKHT